MAKTRGRGPWHTRDQIASKGAKRFRHRRTLQQGKPAFVTQIPRPEKVVRMFKALTENGWKFMFKVEAVSPRGYPYLGEGGTPEKAFLNAFRLYQRDLAIFIPKIPQVVKAI